MKRRTIIKRRARFAAADRMVERAMVRHSDVKASIFDQPEVARCMVRLDRALDLLPPFNAEGKRWKARR
jgi:hypothetical protein